MPRWLVLADQPLSWPSFPFIMKSFQLFFGALFLAHGVWSQFTVPPDTTADPNTIKTCTWWHVAESSDSCASIASLYGITSEQFARWVSSCRWKCSTETRTV